MHYPMLKYMSCLFLALAALLVTVEASAWPGAAVAAKSKNPEFLRATSIVVNAQNHSQFQCWVFRTPFVVSSVPGTAGAATLDLAQLSNATYTVIPPKFNGGRHNAPYKQIVAFFTGTAVLSLPHSSESATIHGGQNGLIVAVDVTGSGHVTKYPSDQQTIALELPFADGKVPEHFITRHNGPCRADEQIIY